MTQGLRLWWRERSLRERRMLAVMLALLALVLAWYGVVRPVRHGLVAAQADHAAALDRNAAIRARLAALKRPMLPRPASNGPLGDRIEASAGEAGFTLARNAASSPGRIDIAIASARPTALFGWIAGLEAEGVAVDTLTVTPAANNTVAAQIVLTEPAR